MEENSAIVDNSQVAAKRLPVGTVIDERYEVLAHLGSGGMGEVYKVLDRTSQTLYALKMISPHVADQKTLAKRLEHEALAARTLMHGNIVTVYDVGKSADGAPYLLMDYVDGEGLDAVLARETVFTSSRALLIFAQIAEALVHAQQKEVVHRDLKPSNILLVKTPNGNDMIKIVDFGIAKISDQDKSDKTKLTQTGDLLGTPLYMSPEQCTGDELDVRSDIYSFGCIMFEMLTGKSPYAAENPVKVILKHLSDDPPKLPANVGISNDLKQVIMRCLEKYRADRYQNAVDLHIDLERIVEGRKIRPYNRKLRVTPRLKLASVAAGVALLGVVGFISFQKAPVPQAPVVQAQHRAEKYKGKTLAQWTAAIEQSPNDPELYVNRGTLHSERDERTNAVDDFTQAIALNPDYLEAFRQRAEMYTLLAQYDKAAQDANTLIAKAPDSPQGYQTRGWMYGAREQFAEAMADMSNANAIKSSAWNCYQLAVSQMKLGDFAAASRSIAEAQEMEPDYGPAKGIAGLIYTFQQQYQKAGEQLISIKKDPDARGVEWQLLAYYYLASGKPAEGQQAVDQAKSLETFPARAFRLAGEYYRTAGQYDKAIQEFSASTSLEEYPPGYRQRAVSYISMGQWRSAYVDLKKSIQLNPFSPNTLSYLALAESHLGMKAAAAEHIGKALKAKALEPIVYLNEALIALNNNDLPKAASAVDTAIKRDPWLKEAYTARANVRERQGNASGAKSDIDKASKLISHLDF